MENFKFFNKFKVYREYVMDDIFRTPEFRDNRFYKGLIEFVLRHRAPIFFFQTKEEEFSHFTQYFNLVLDRSSYYTNDFVRSMYFAHDFVHMVFLNPLWAKDLTFERFCEILNINEWVASNETETLTYYRIDSMREKSLPYTILYDLLQAAGFKDKPSVKWLLDLRRDIIQGKPLPVGLTNHPDSEVVLSYFRKFIENNHVWLEAWHQGMPRITAPYEYERLSLSVLDYEHYLTHYRPEKRDEQKMYELNMLLNVTNMVELLQNPAITIPKRFDECQEKLDQMEGMIIMPDVASHFYSTYQKNKAVGTQKIEKVIV